VGFTVTATVGPFLCNRPRLRTRTYSTLATVAPVKGTLNFERKNVFGVFPTTGKYNNNNKQHQTFELLMDEVRARSSDGQDASLITLALTLLWVFLR
jgi:hypothetical protein